jgi:hypothetical protein
MNVDDLLILIIEVVVGQRDQLVKVEMLVPE